MESHKHQMVLVYFSVLRMSHSLNSLKGVYRGVSIIGVNKGDTKSLDKSSYRHGLQLPILLQMEFPEY